MHRLAAAAPAAALLVVTAVWGSTFIVLKDTLNHVAATDFLAVRFTLAALIMVCATAPRLRQLSGGQWGRGVLLGAVYGLAQILQTVGLKTTDAAVSGFITGMYVVLTPLLLFLIARTPMSRTALTASVMALVGLGVLSLRGFAFSGGAAITFGGSLVYALHIVLLGALSRDQDAAALTATQMIGIAGICSLSALPGGVAIPSTARVWGPLLYMVLASGIATMFLQTWAQARMSSTRVAVIMTCEPVFAALFATIIGHEPVTPRLVLGGSLIVGAMLMAELGARPSWRYCEADP